MDLVSQSDSLEPNKKSSNLWLIIATVVIILVGLLLFLLFTGFINLKNTNKAGDGETTSELKTYQMATYQISLPKEWGILQETTSFSASDTQKPIRKITVTLVDYDQSLTDAYKKSPTNPPSKSIYIYYARYLTAECYADESKGCFRIYYIWNEDQKKMAKIRIEWEKGTNNQAASGIEDFRNEILNNFKFNE